MVKLIGRKKNKTAVFISGRGSNLKSLINYSKKKKSKIKICLIVSDNMHAKGLRFSKKNKIKKIIVNFNKKNSAENIILKELKSQKIKLICLAGFMKILSKKFIKKFKNPILNIHPSLLPKYKGINTHKRAIQNNEKYTGCTVHFVNEKLDSGRIILQKKIKILKKDNIKKISSKVLRIEHKVYPLAIEKILS